jgi:hypothetical protein
VRRHRRKATAEKHTKGGRTYKRGIRYLGKAATEEHTKDERRIKKEG